MPSLYCDDKIILSPEVLRLGFSRAFPSRSLQTKLNDKRRQQLIPFLGAGASISPGSPPTQHCPTAPLSGEAASALKHLIETLGLTEDISKAFLKVATEVARLLDTSQDRTSEGDAGLGKASQAPSAWQLASIIAKMLELRPYRPYADTLESLLNTGVSSNDECLRIIAAVAKLLNLNHSIPQLLTVGSYFPHENRAELRTKLLERFDTVTESTTIQRQLALQAKGFVDARNGDDPGVETTDYLLITTNYDRLMELELEKLKVPYWVVTVDFDMNIYTTFSDRDHCNLSDADYLALKTKFDGYFANNFTRVREKPACVLIYKMHGCPKIDMLESANNIVIGDTDYVRFIESNGRSNEMIPFYIKQRMLLSRLLFLGYSFSDWNIRGFYENFTKRRGVENPKAPSSIGPTDYIVLRSYSLVDHLYFKRWNDDLSILVTDLNGLAKCIAST
jgi:SIR2-like domain